jgi:hypothetical protein
MLVLPYQHVKRCLIPALYPFNEGLIHLLFAHQGQTPYTYEGTSSGPTH